MTPNDSQLDRILRYITDSFDLLARDNRQLLLAARDPKVAPQPERWPVYISRLEEPAMVEATLRAVVPAADMARIDLRPLPDDPASITEHGLLLLPFPYLVPGGRFNEQYGWDSFWIVRGLLLQGETVLARNMVDNFIYEIIHYGTLLNANRTYYLTRSQPPLLTGMILAVYRQTKDRAWLRRTLPALEQYYRYWTDPAQGHLTTTGLSRYFDAGHGPAPEVEAAEDHYGPVRDYFAAHPDPDYYDPVADCLTDAYYKADRSMRESGFDPSSRFGPFNADICQIAPVCLNTLLYLMEEEMAEILGILRQHGAADLWRQRARARDELINRYLWDEGAGYYQDYDLKRGERRRYLFATTFYPLWAGLADEEQAKRVVDTLAYLEAPGGLKTSDQISLNQWDAPFGWAPLTTIAFWGLRRYGYDREAYRIAINFLSLILKEFVEHNAIFEKYDVMARDSAMPAGMRGGYSTNEIGFGWTNAAFIELLAEVPRLPFSGIGWPGERRT
jgi:alpha,alpha-trehalase